MKKNSALNLTLVLVFCVIFAALAILSFNGKNPLYAGNIQQGLDLQGGISILYEADTDNVSQADMDAAVALMRGRLDSQGYTEAEVTQVGTDRIQVDIPGVKDAEEAVSSIGATAQLVFLDEDFNILLTGADVTGAHKEIQKGQNGIGDSMGIVLEFNSEGKAKFAKATEDNIGKTITIMLDDEVLSVATVHERIDSNSAVITGNFTPAEAERIATLIRSGSLPFGLNIISITNAGALLGAEALSTSITAGVIGVIIVLLFMLFVYRAFGLVADIALILYVGLMMFFLNILNITLTLPGIAGIILSIGMAVDANIIIFERIKEEIKAGKTLRVSSSAGFKRAFPAIIDGNVTTLIAAVILLWLGTGPIKGFAQTLALGIILSMFTALVITKTVLESFIGLGIDNKNQYGIKDDKVVATSKEA